MSLMCDMALAYLAAPVVGVRLVQKRSWQAQLQSVPSHVMQMPLCRCV